jgi:hypothetical protein
MRYLGSAADAAGIELVALDLDGTLKGSSSASACV